MVKNKVDIVLPNRIGDIILTLPAILCLKQLERQYAPENTAYRLLTHVPMTRLLQALNLFEVTQIDLTAKIKSWINPSEKVFFLSTTNKNIGFHAKTTYGLHTVNKKMLCYSINLPYLLYPEPSSVLPDELVTFLRENFQLTRFSIKHFGLCLELGYKVEEIRNTFQFDSSSLPIDSNLFNCTSPIASDYLVFCMEAASGRKKHNSDRRWKEEHFFDLAEKAHKEYGLLIAFMGLSDQPELPDKPYFIDFRGKLDLTQSAQLLHFSRGYVGNDTGPLHLANLLKKRSIGMYFREVAVSDYRPVFPHYNKVFYKPKSPDEIFSALDELILSTTE